MLPEFDRARAQFIEERSVEQQKADRACGELYKRIGAILQAESIKKDRPIRALIAALGEAEAWMDQERLSPDELRRYWTVSREVNLAGERPETVRLTAYGGKTPTEAHRTFIHIEGIPHFLEIQEDHGVIWKREQKGNRTFSTREKTANIVEANFYENVLTRFQAQGKAKN